VRRSTKLVESKVSSLTLRLVLRASLSACRFGFLFH
jgi:hypothetical protein